MSRAPFWVKSTRILASGHLSASSGHFMKKYKFVFYIFYVYHRAYICVLFLHYKGKYINSHVNKVLYKLTQTVLFACLCLYKLLGLAFAIIFYTALSRPLVELQCVRAGSMIYNSMATLVVHLAV